MGIVDAVHGLIDDLAAGGAISADRAAELRDVVDADGDGGPTMTKAELMDRAAELDIAGRSSMSKDELERAIAAEEGQGA